MGANAIRWIDLLRFEEGNLLPNFGYEMKYVTMGQYVKSVQCYD